MNDSATSADVSRSHYTITLTPGTLTVDVVDNRLLVHWVYRPPGTDIQQATEKIASTFERHLSRFLI